MKESLREERTDWGSDEHLLSESKYKSRSKLGLEQMLHSVWTSVEFYSGKKSGLEIFGNHPHGKDHWRPNCDWNNEGKEYIEKKGGREKYSRVTHNCLSSCSSCFPLPLLSIPLTLSFLPTAYSPKCCLSALILVQLPSSSAQVSSLSQSVVTLHTHTWVHSQTAPLRCDHPTKYFDLEHFELKRNEGQVPESSTQCNSCFSRFTPS